VERYMFNLFKKKFDIDKVMDEYDKREKYSRITSELIDTLADDALLQALYDYVQKVIVFGNSKTTYTQYCNLPIGIQDVFAIYYFELAEESDGLNCYFDYDYGLFAEEAIRAFTSIKALTSKDLIVNCIVAEFGSIDRFKQIREQYYEYSQNRVFNDKLSELEREYTYHTDYSDKTLIEYIRNNKELFMTH
jgi:hypothetical protein